ncbi:MAG: ArsJ-associated glyceraldehyde-3-phosphate dehydrogenase [Pseudomonadota bacterium]
MGYNIGINGFGRMGRLITRLVQPWSDIRLVHINDPEGDVESFAHLLNFDSIQGRWHQQAEAQDDILAIDADRISCSRNRFLGETDWSKCDLVFEASGQFRSQTSLQTYLDQGVGRVIVTAPVHDPAVPNIVVGVNHHEYQPDQHPIVSAASCTTNCLAPIVKVIHPALGIEHGSITTIHDITNTQQVLDAHHKDLRRARAASLNLIPTTTGSAKAINGLFPELEGRLSGHAVRVPLANASLTDCVFELATQTDANTVNGLLTEASKAGLTGILGVETRPLVSSDYCGDSRSCIVDAQSTLVINETHLRLYAWYDNEWAYVNRCADLLRMALALGPAGS